MTKIKLCGLSRICDIEAANELRPEYIGFVFAGGSRRRISPKMAAELKKLLSPGITAVGVFAGSPLEEAAGLLDSGVIDMAQLHGGEDEEYVRNLRSLTGRPVIKAFRMDGARSAEEAQNSAADFVLLDAGSGCGKRFDWRLAEPLERPYFLAGGLDAASVAEAIKALRPYAVDVSSGIETDGLKDKIKMEKFIRAARSI